MTNWLQSRQTFFVKGETSCHIQYLKNIRLHRNVDTILLLIGRVDAIFYTDQLRRFDMEINNKSKLVQLCLLLFSNAVVAEHTL